MKRTIRKSMLAAALLAGGSFIATPTLAAELVYGAFISPKHGVMRHALPIWGKAIAKATNNEITWKFVGGGQLVDVKGSLPGIKEGLVDGAFVIAPFAPSNLPSTNVIFSTQVFGEDTIAAAGASNETVLLHCPSCLTEAKNNNLVQLGGYATTPYLLMCRKDVSSVAELKGLKIRSAGGGVALMRMGGATPVAMAPAAATQALQRGALDCVHGAASWLRSYGYEDVVKAIVDYPLGVGTPAMHLAMSRKRYLAMTPAQRKAHVDASPASVASAVIDAYIISDTKILERAKKKGVKFIKGGKDFDELVAKRIKAQRDDIIGKAQKFNVPNPGRILDAYDAALVKWRKLSKDIGTDTKKFEAALKREIYDKLDPEKL
ncbi:MAG: TRAP transporter substrate-binding protein DctP [Beijerinckiaceae bacterium]